MGVDYWCALDVKRRIVEEDQIGEEKNTHAWRVENPECKKLVGGRCIGCGYDINWHNTVKKIRYNYSHFKQ